ncbi:hypothetical protein KPE94_08915 [Acinetobacter seifertii]|nr:hypothetical protein [Acinetobacter seifertii]
MIKSIISGCAVLTLSAFAVTHAEFSFEQELQLMCAEKTGGFNLVN